ncbi:Protein CBR-SMN-1 [Caenorhabditis briggsae]|uniref:Tudor domain-containing protein n=3 Tax=Caenorhabditis briggsae TaxID=6238 RepID=A0AAE9IZ20_CAEBR|nr:Protein CBR-SMN-1 [Caenorhabditis briggsae]ULU11060.1 hypothetical protein L3Y34_014931 [Caenorhabditis briggsae]UMM12021.1 hypothetical protein L5515_001010 [Caenorhabditis briggsae]CAP21086.1 Protein CBR-SMN-1 [Caenorhabditis briggsae]
MTNVWSAKNGMDVDDVWDDTELIKMYDQSIQEVYSQKSGVTERQFKGEDGKTYTWKVGGHCMAPFEDEYFPATIDSIGGKNNLQVQVTFFYYGNQENVHMKDLWMNEEAISKAVALEQQKESEKKSSKACSSHTSSNHLSSAPLPNFAPPVPPNIIAMAPANQQEALSSMLMSWYMSGYHTGYYQALSDNAHKH